MPSNETSLEAVNSHQEKLPQESKIKRSKNNDPRQHTVEDKRKALAITKPNS